MDEVKDIPDKVLAMQAYARQAKDTQLMQGAAEIKVRAEHKLGEMLREQKETVGMNAGQLHRGSVLGPRDDSPTQAALLRHLWAETRNQQRYRAQLKAIYEALGLNSLPGGTKKIVA